MPTYTITSVAGGTFTHTLNYSTADAQRIFNGWVKQMQQFGSGTGTPPVLTTQGFVDWMAQRAALEFQQWVKYNETVVNPPIPPDITSS